MQSNGGLKRAFPYLDTPRAFEDHDEVVEDMITCLHLWNARTRLVGFNQVNTMYRRHYNKNFRRAIARGTSLEAYVAECKEAFAEGDAYGVLPA